MRKIIGIVLFMALVLPLSAQCDLKLKEKAKGYSKGVFLRETFFVTDLTASENPDKADSKIVLNKGTTYEYIFLSSDKYQGKVSAKFVNVKVDKETNETTVKHLVFDMEQTYFVDGVMRTKFTCPETAVYYLFIRSLDGQKACVYSSLYYISNNRPKSKNKKK